jgi:sugar phosphate permease
LKGAATVIGGLGGTLLGGLVADFLKDKTKNPYLAVSAVTLMIASLLTVITLLIRKYVDMFTCVHVL